MNTNWIKMNKKSFCCLFIIYTLATSSIIRANFNYIDDMGRIAEGYSMLGQFSRYVSDILSKLLHGDKYLTDISPLSQVIAIAICCIASIIIIKAISGKETFSVWEIVAVLPLGLSPYFLECISYKYDSPYMALSVLAGVLPIVFYKYGYFVYAIAVLIGTLIMCMTYQASSGVFPMLVILLAFIAWNKGENSKKILQFILVSAGGFLAGLVIFQGLIAKKIVDSYVSIAITSSKGIMQNLKCYFNYIRNDFKTEWILCIILLIISFVYISIRDSCKNKFFACICSLIVICMMVLVCFGAYPILEQPLFAPRGMYGFGVFIAYIGVFVAAGKKVYPAKIISIILSWFFVVFALTYGNALEVQKEYTDFRITSVIEDLNDMETFTTDDTKIIQISGSIGQSPVLRQMPQDYQILNRLVPITFRQDWYWGTYGFFHYYGLQNVKEDTSIDLTKYNLPIIKDTMYHTIYGNQEYVLIELK